MRASLTTSTVLYPRVSGGHYWTINPWRRVPLPLTPSPETVAVTSVEMENSAATISGKGGTRFGHLFFIRLEEGRYRVSVCHCSAGRITPGTCPA